MHEFAIEMALRAGKMLLDIQKRGINGRFVTKRSHMDLVTEGDVACEALISQLIRGRYPDHAICGEEGVSAAAQPSGSVADEAARSFDWTGWTWTIDPVDGTTNFAHGLPLFAVNIGLLRGRTPVLGITHAPALGLTFWAEEGNGAWLRRSGTDQRMHVSTIDDLSRALLTTGFPYDRATVPDNNLAEWTTFDTLTQGVRRLGSAALSIAWVAAGTMDAYWESRAQVWDWAPGTMLVREAGGLVTDFEGRPWEPGFPTMIASNGQSSFHQTLRETIATTRTQSGLSG